MSKNLLFSFDEMGSQKDAATKKLVQYFSRAGNNVVQGDVSPGVKRTSGISFREMLLTFADSQKVIIRIKQSGDIFQVLLNGKTLPIKNQDDHIKAIAEISQVLDAGRAKFQKLMATVKVSPPAGIRTAAPKMEQVLTEKRDSLKSAIASVREEIASLSASVSPA